MSKKEANRLEPFINDLVGVIKKHNQAFSIDVEPVRGVNDISIKVILLGLSNKELNKIFEVIHQ